jgi:hypothetical protein
MSMPTLPHQPCRAGEGHLLAQHQHQGLEQQGEADSLPADGGSTWRTAPHGNRTCGTRTSRKHSCWKK